MGQCQENVLLIAFGCEPGRGSEPGIGWANAHATARARPTWILTHPRHREVLEAEIQRRNTDPSTPRMQAVYVGLPALLRPLERLGYAGFNVYYYLWILLAGRVAVQLHRKVRFALVQHVSLMRWWMPSPAHALAKRGVAFIWGPLSSGEIMPWRFQRGIGLRGRLTEFSRLTARWLFCLDPRLSRCARSATLALGAHDETQARLKRLGCARVERALAAPGDIEIMRQIEPAPKKPGTFRIVSGGGMVYWKAFDLSVRAFAEASADMPEAEYVHVCGGGELPRVQRLAEQLGVAGRVRLLGEMPHHEALRWVASADMLVHPVLRDTNGHILEALAAGVPVLTINHLSPNALVDETCGRRIRLEACRTRGDLVEALAVEMRSWFADTALRKRLSDGAQRRAQQLSAEAFACQTDALQTDVLRRMAAGEHSQGIRAAAIALRMG